MTNILPLPQELRPALPTIEGNVDYSEYRRQLLRIDDLLVNGGVESDFLQASLDYWSTQDTGPMPKISVQQQLHFQQQSIRALRCNIARTLLGESFRMMSCRIADSPLLQWFCHIDQLDRVKVPSKSALQRYADWLPSDQMRPIINRLVCRAGQGATAQAPQPLGLNEPLDLDVYFLDATCLKANIHFPVDWVLLRDATRTLMKATLLIRDHGLRHRMRPPELFIKMVNQQAIAMTHARRKADSKKARKQILRRIKKLVGAVRRHAKRHRDMLERCWAETDWTRVQAQQVIGRIDEILEQLPRAIKQAHERIIGERLVPSTEKILSLYEPDVHVLVRGKSGAEVEFGNTLVLGESPDGLIVDWKLYQEQAPSDAGLVRPSVERVKAALGTEAIKTVVGDRGLDSARNAQWLEGEGIGNALCPRDPVVLSQKMGEERFRRLQQRRGQTEGRIGIFKNCFLGRPLKAKGFGNRETSVAWAVLTHNLWVLARREQASSAQQREAA